MDACKRCGSFAINHRYHGRDGSNPDMCDVCYWRHKAEILREALGRIAKLEYGSGYFLTVDEKIARDAIQQTGGE